MAFEDYDVSKAFERIEDELIASMMRNLRRHLQEEDKLGFDWSQWQVEQLRYLQEYRKRNKKKFGPQFKEINKKVVEAIRDAADKGGKDEEKNILKQLTGEKAKPRRRRGEASVEGAGDAFFRINDKKLEALVKATNDDLTRAEHAVLRRTNDQYRKIIFDAQVYANTGAGTIEQAIDMATKDFLSRGIDCIEYKNGARHTIKDYVDMYIRTAERRAYLMGEGQKRQEWGEELVIVNKRGGHPCLHCIPWLGKVLIDDVYSGGKPDGKHKLLSDAMAAGFLHPRCKDGFTTFFPGISSAPDPDAVTKKDLQKAVKAEKEEARESYAQRQAEKYERLAEHSLDPENRMKYEARASEWGQKSEELTERRKQRLAQRRTPEASSEQSVEFDDRVSEKQRQILEQLSAQYRTRLQKVTIGAERAAGDVDISGSRMRLSGKDPATAIHEFAHTLANTSADKYGLTHDQDFWKEIKKIRREYMKDVEGDSSRWISSYEHSNQSVDEFMAEAFAHAKMRELGLVVPDQYGKDFTYSQKVLDTVNKYFRRMPQADEGEALDGLRRIVKSRISNDKIVSYRGLTEGVRKKFENGLINSDPMVKKLIRKNRSFVDYIEKSGRSMYVHGVPGTIIIDPKSPPGTLAHELFHYIDHQKDISKRLKKDLLKDYSALQAAGGENVKLYLMKRYPHAFKINLISGKAVLKPEYRGIADILNGLSGGEVSYGSGHRKEYWKKKGKLESESWAQFGRVFYDNIPEVKEMFSDLFPNFEENAILIVKEEL